MTKQELLSLIEEGVKHGRIAPSLAAYIAAELSDGEAYATESDDYRYLETVEDR